MPSKVAIVKWLNNLNNKYDYFREQYKLARQIQAELLADEIFDIVDDGTNDWMERHGEDSPGYAFNSEHYQRSRLRTDTRKWYLSKVLPKIYGDKLGLEHTGKNGGPIEFDNLSDEQLESKLTKLLGKAGIDGATTGEGAQEESEQD